jgi:hypothetical protein
MSFTRQTARGIADPLVNLIIALLAPMFLWSCQGDAALARAAAAETLNAYCAAGNLTLIRAAKVLAFDLATLSSLSLSMLDETSAAFALRLRGNAVSLDRAAERNRAALEQDRRNPAIAAQAADLSEDDAAASMPEAKPEPQPLEPRPPAPEARAPMTEPQRNTARAGAMAEDAAGITAELNGLSPAERAADRMRIEALMQTATALASGTALPPYLAASSLVAAPPARAQTVRPPLSVAEAIAPRPPAESPPPAARSAPACPHPPAPPAAG